MPLLEILDWVVGLIYGVMLVFLLSVAEGDYRGFELHPRHEKRAPRLFSEAEIPTDEQTWRACCDHRDCKEGSVHVFIKSGDHADVSIDRYPVFELEASKIFRSTNGKSYFCRKDLSRAPDRENTRCVFYGRPSYVRRF